jgi:hypothetical protein
MKEMKRIQNGKKNDVYITGIRSLGPRTYHLSFIFNLLGVALFPFIRIKNNI